MDKRSCLSICFIHTLVIKVVEDILIVSGRGKRAIEDHFDKSWELEEVLAKNGKFAELEQIRATSEMANIHYIRQKEPKGLGHAIWCARTFVGDEPFAVLLGDDIVQSEQPCLSQLITVYNRYQSPVLGVQQVPDTDVGKYGIIDPRGSEIEPNLIYDALPITVVYDLYMEIYSKIIWKKCKK